MTLTEFLSLRIRALLVKYGRLLASCNITIEESNQWVVFDGTPPNDQPWLDALDHIEEFVKIRDVDSVARAGIMWRTENGAPLMEQAQVVRACHPTQEMLELFSPTFDHASLKYQKCVGKSLPPPFLLSNTDMSL